MVKKKTVISKDGASIYYEIHRAKKESAQQASFKKVLGSPRGLGQTFSQELAAPSQTLFLIHGIGGDTDGWQFVRDHMLAEKYTTISMDVRGHGHSHHPKKISDYEIEKIEEDIDAILAQENIDKPVVIGHSGGAIIAARYAATRLDKLAGLVLIAGSYCPPSYLSSTIMRSLAHAAIRIGGFLSPPPYKNPARQHGGWHSPYPPGKHHKEFELYGLVRTMFYNSLRSYLYLSRALITVDLHDKLKHITIPTLLIAGEDDGIFPVHISKKMHQEIPAANLVVLQKTNHVSILNNPQEVAYAILHFLRF